MVKIMLLISCAYPSDAMCCFDCSCSSLASLGTNKGCQVHKRLYALHSSAVLQWQCHVAHKVCSVQSSS